MYELQKASLLKRFSAFLLDFILMTIAVTGFAWFISAVTGFYSHVTVLETKKIEYENSIGLSGANSANLEVVDFSILKEDYDKLTEEERAKIDSAYTAYHKDEAVVYAKNMIFNLALIMATLSLLLSYLLLEFAIPMMFKNGQTVGKKIFSVGVIHLNGVRISGIAVFTRAILGKFAIETMVPILICLTMIAGGGGIVGIIVLGLILLLEAFVFFKDRKNTLLHDMLSMTVCVDLPSQMVFDTEDELIAYKKKLHEEVVKESTY